MINLIELIGITIYLGFPVYVVGTGIFIAIIYKKIKLGKGILLTCLEFLLSLGLSLVIWLIWPFRVDIVAGFIMLPALLAEIISIFTLFFLWKKVKRD